jgi:N,N'-diacetyllegionaminate synthase
MSKVIIIAEAGVNHNGDITIAKKLIDAAAKAKVDYVKFQTWITDEIVTRDAPKAEYQKLNDGLDTSQYDMLKKLELSFNDFRELQIYAKQKGVGFLSTPDEYKSLDFLAEELCLPILKIGSGEVTNYPFLNRFAQKKIPVILSTGMSSLEEVRKAYKILKENGAPKISILHCTSNYPATYDSVNLKAMLLLENEFKVDVGYSDHTKGIEISLAAVALGAKIIEKHFTLDKNMEGPDHIASIEPYELEQLVLQIRNIEQAISGNGFKVPTNTELETKQIVQKGIYANCDLSAGDILTDEVLIMKRPVKEISASEYDNIINKKITVSIKKGDAISYTFIEK